MTTENKAPSSEQSKPSRLDLKAAFTPPAQGAVIHEYKLRILERHLDSFGHVNNATYLELFEEARWDIITRQGFGLEEVKKAGIGPTILEIKLHFRREIHNREEVTIRTWVAHHLGKVSTLRQVMYNEKGEQGCLAEFAIALFDLKARKLIDPTPEWEKAISLI